MKSMIALAAALLVAGPALAQTRSDPPGTAAERTYDRSAGTNSSGAFPSQSDGTPGNPRGTAVERTFDRTTGSNTARQDPPGTAAERLLDRAAGTNSSGAFPAQSDGRPGNPPGTAVGREVDRQTR